ncbi:MAG: response regulator [Sphingobacteriales bacterium]
MDKRILILDDNRAILDVVTEALVYEQYTVLDISLGSQLFHAVRDFSPDLILLDYRLADASGGDLCRQLKNTPKYRDIPVVIFSAYVNPGDFLQRNCDGYLYKPFDLAELFKVVRDLLPASKEVSL